MPASSNRSGRHSGDRGPSRPQRRLADARIASITNWMCCVEVDTQLLRAQHHVVAAHARANALSFIFFRTDLASTSWTLFDRLDERRRGDQSRQLVDGEQRSAPSASRAATPV